MKNEIKMTNIWQNVLACDALCNPFRAPNNPSLSILIFLAKIKKFKYLSNVNHFRDSISSKKEPSVTGEINVPRKM